MIYSRMTNPAPPPSCNRIVNGIVKYEVVGWSVERKHIGFLLPMTIIIFISLTLIFIAFIEGDSVFNEFDPTDQRSLIFASGNPPMKPAENVPTENVPPRRDPTMVAPKEWLDYYVDYNLSK